MKLKIIITTFIVFISLFIILLGIRLKWLPQANIFYHKILNPLSSNDRITSTTEKDNKLELNILKKLNDFEVKKNNIKKTFIKDKNLIIINAAIPQGIPDECIILELNTVINSTSYNITDCIINKEKEIYNLSFASNDKHKEKLLLIITKADQYIQNSSCIALLVENFKFNADKTTIDFLSFPHPLTVSIVPFFPGADLTAKAADQYKKELIIRLPFEPLLAKNRKEISAGSTIMLHYPENKITEIIENAARIAPNYKGFSNLNGNLSLEDSRIMEIVLYEIKKRNSYFIEKYDGEKSVSMTIADKIKVPCLKTDATISESRNVEIIEQQLKNYVDTARKLGRILITIPASQAMIDALHKILPYLQKYGIKFVYVSDIIKTDNK